MITEFQNRKGIITLWKVAFLSEKLKFDKIAVGEISKSTIGDI